jgi:uncharacterized membrane protein YbhN (UPF0104 family)
VLGIGLVVLVAVGLGLLLARAAGFREVVDALERADPVWFPLCLGGQVVSYAGYVVAFRGVMAMDGGARVPPWPATRVVLASMGANRVIAAAGAGGLAIVYWSLRRVGMAPSQSAARMLGLNILVFGLFGVWATLAALLLALGLGHDVPLAMALPWLVVVPACIAAGAWVSASSRAGRLGEAPAGAGWLRRAFAAAVGGLVVVRHVLHRRGAATLGGALAYWAGDVASLWFALRSVGADPRLHEVALAYATAYLAVLVPLPTGGFGGLDAAATFTLTLLDLPLATALVGVVVWRFFNFWLPTIPGVVELVRLRDLGRTLTRGAVRA